MNLLYTVIITVCALTSLTLFFHMMHSPVLTGESKLWFTLVLLWVLVGNVLDGWDVLFRVLETDPKLRLGLACIHLCLSPWLPILLGNAVGLNRHTQFGSMVLLLHMVLELVFLPFQAILYVDEAGTLRQGEYYFLYVLFYAVSLLTQIYLIYLLSKRFLHKDRITLIFATLTLLVGLIPPVFEAECKSAYLGLTLSTLMVYLYYESILQENRVLDQQEHDQRLEKMQHQMILGVMGLIEHKGDNTGKHAKNISSYVEGFSRALQEEGLFPEVLDDHFLDLLVSVAPLYDVGKIKIPDSILEKKEKLTQDEFDLVKTHAREGGEFLLTVLGKVSAYENMKIAVDVATYHHEWWDGTGYPLGLREEEIPLSARIVALADAYEALTHDKPYREAYTSEDALSILQGESGTHFDPSLTPVFVRYIREKVAISR